MSEAHKPLVCSPPPEQLREIAHQLHRFLLAAKECKCVRKSKRIPAPRRPQDHSLGDLEVYLSLYELEIALNLRRLAFDDKRRASMMIADWPNVMRFSRLLRTLREEVDATLQDWGWESVCTSKAMSLSIAGIDGHATGDGILRPGTVGINMPQGWRPWVRESIFDELTIVRDAFVEYLAWYAAAQSQKPETEIDELVTLSQVAPLTGVSKRTLERYLKDDKLPQPDFPGGEGKSHKWHWSTLHPALSKLCNRILLSRFPGARII